MVWGIFNRLLQLCLQVNLERRGWGQSLNGLMWVEVQEVNGLHSFPHSSLSTFVDLILLFMLWGYFTCKDSVFIVCICVCFLIFINNQFYSLHQEICRSIVVIYFVVNLDFNLSSCISKLYAFTRISIHFILMWIFSHFSDCLKYIFLIPVLYYFYYYIFILKFYLIWLNFSLLSYF